MKRSENGGWKPLIPTLLSRLVIRVFFYVEKIYVCILQIWGLCREIMSRRQCDFGFPQHHHSRSVRFEVNTSGKTSPFSVSVPPVICVGRNAKIPRLCLLSPKFDKLSKRSEVGSWKICCQGVVTHWCRRTRPWRLCFLAQRHILSTHSSYVILLMLCSYPLVFSERNVKRLISPRA